jgi:hypothetical protein
MCGEHSGAGLTKKEHRQGEVSEKCGRWRVRRPEVRSPRRELEVTTEATGTFEQEPSSRCRIWPSWEAKSEMSAWGLAVRSVNGHHSWDEDDIELWAFDDAP